MRRSDRSRCTAALAVLVCLTLAPSCRRGPRDAKITYYGARSGVSLRHPASWTSEAAEDTSGGVYRHFMAPARPGEKVSRLTASLLVEPVAGSLDDYAQRFLAGKSLTSSRDEQRPGAAMGKSYVYADGASHYALLLLQEGPTVHGLFLQGDSTAFAEHAPAVDEMMASLTLERPSLYPQHQEARSAFSVRLPPSWRESRRFSSSGMLMVQYLSPVIGADRDTATVQASLTITAEPAGSGGLEAFYQANRKKLGEAFNVIRHDPWKDGYVDLITVETGVSASRSKRFYRVAGGRGYCMAFEAREDVFHRVSAWFDVIASTFEAP